MSLDTLLNSLSEKNRRLAIMGSVGVLTFVFTMGTVVNPSLKKIKSFDRQKTQWKEKEPLLREIQDLQTRLSAYKKYMFQSRNLAPVNEDLAQMGEKASIRIATIEQEKTVATAAEGQAEKLSVNIEGSGTFHALGDFASRIESIDTFFLKISRLSFGFSESSFSTSSSAVSADSAAAGIKKIELTASALYQSGDSAV